MLFSIFAIVGFIVWGLTVRSLIHFELIFAYDAKLEFTVTFKENIIPQYHLLKLSSIFENLFKYCSSMCSNIASVTYLLAYFSLEHLTMYTTSLTLL